LHGRVLAVAAGAQMRGDALALGEHLDGSRGEPDLDLILREAVGHAVIVPVDIDVIIEIEPSLIFATKCAIRPSPPNGHRVGELQSKRRIK